MSAINPPGFLQNAGATHTAAQMRTWMATLQAGNYSAATTLRTRGGVHPSLGNQLAVTQAGSPNMTVLVDTGVCSIPGTESSTQGNYFAGNDASVTLSISAAHATLPRIDIVVVNIRDAAYSGASNDSQIQVVTGTPAASPAVPTAPNNSITLAQVAVGAAVTSIVNANITDTRTYMASVGGIIPIRNIAAAPTSAEMVEGQLLWAMDTNVLYVFDGSNNRQIWPVTAPIHIHEAACSLTLALTTSDQDVAGASVTFSTNSSNAVYSVVASFDAYLAAAGAGVTFIGSLMVDGVLDAGGSFTFSGQTTGDRGTICGIWTGTLPSSGSHTLKLRGRKDINSGTLQFIANSTQLIVTVYENG